MKTLVIPPLYWTEWKQLDSGRMQKFAKWVGRKKDGSETKVFEIQVTQYVECLGAEEWNRLDALHAEAAALKEMENLQEEWDWLPFEGYLLSPLLEG
jgi:hypothetical protein